MNNGGGNGGGSFKVKHGSNAAEVTNVHEQDRERLKMHWLEKEIHG